MFKPEMQHVQEQRDENNQEGPVNQEPNTATTESEESAPATEPENHKEPEEEDEGGGKYDIPAFLRRR